MSHNPADRLPANFDQQMIEAWQRGVAPGDRTAVRQITDQRDFDAACNEFTDLLVHARNWKHTYFGACYSSRIRHAVEDLRRALEIAETRIIGK